MDRERLLAWYKNRLAKQSEIFMDQMRAHCRGTCELELRAFTSDSARTSVIGSNQTICHAAAKKRVLSQAPVSSDVRRKRA